MTILVWFRRDLRVTDHTALHQAIQQGATVVPFFIISDETIRTQNMGAPITHFFFESLRALQGNLAHLGGGLVIRRGDFLTEIEKLSAETGAKALFFNKDYEPNALARDQRVTAFLSAKGLEVQSFKDQVYFEERELLTASGTPYTVFTPYSRAWRNKAHQIPMPSKAPFHVPIPSNFHELYSDFIPSLAELKLRVQPYTLLSTPGEKAGREAIKAFLAESVQQYKNQRDFPAKPGTSLLSPHLRAGTISIRTLYWQLQDLLAKADETSAIQIETYLNELIWRDFYHQILFNFPQVATQNFKTNFDTVAWRNDPHEIQAWKTGQTGYPIVDAAMRQLVKHGWMHNRLRMITAMFLTKHLLTHWQIGEAFFAHHLIDFDLAANNGGWQWSASTGTDAQPYFRIFNPIEQAKKFDPEGHFIRQYLPELAKVPPAYVHAPWEMPLSLQKAMGCIIGQAYPFPIVEHKFARERALAAFKQEKPTTF